MSVFIFILALVLLIVVHEFGHFSVAKLFRIRVDEFSVFFPPRLLTWRRGETLYSLGALPLGGFVKIFGEDGDAAKDARSFSGKPRAVQVAVLAAGVVFNIAFAWLALSAGYMYGLPAAAEHNGWGMVTNSRPTIAGVLPGSPAEQAGVVAGDIVLSMQTATELFDLRTLSTDRQAELVRTFIYEHPDNSIGLTVLRGNEEKLLLATPAEGLVEGRKALGIEVADFGVLKLPPYLALLEGARGTWHMTASTAQGLSSFFGSILKGTADFAAVSGPIGIVAYGASAANQGIAPLVMLTVLISINLAIINLLPIPGLDGGRILITLVEGILRRRIPENMTTALTLAGFGLLLLLMLVVSYHDIVRLLL